MLTLIKKVRYLCIAIIVIAGIGFTISPQQHTTAQTGAPTVCPSGFSIIAPLASSTIKGVQPLELTVPTVYTVTQAYFVFDLPASGIPNTTNIYNATQQGALWVSSISTQALTDGIHTIGSMVTFQPTSASPTVTCLVTPYSVIVNNGSTPPPVSSSLNLTLNMASWVGPTNYPINFIATTKLIQSANATDVTTQAVYTWSTTVGAIQQAVINSNTATFGSPSAGTGQVTVTAQYGTLKQSVSIPINVVTATSLTSYPSITPTTKPLPTTAPTQPSGSPTTTTPIASTSSPTQGDTQLQACLISILGATKYQSLINTKQPLDFSQLQETAQCFAQRNNVIPVNLAPITPTQIKTLPVDAQKIGILTFGTISNNGKDAISITGTALPNKTVLIYVFSEPLVLTTTSDSNGQWSYTLQDPLQPGNHEAYVAVDNSQSPIRSNAYGFAIATTTKTSQNPFGYSLIVQHKVNPNTYYTYYAAALIIVIITAILFILFIVRRKQHKMISTGGDIPPMVDSNGAGQTPSIPSTS